MAETKDTQTATYTVADYLFDRVAETGATEVFGVPGDFNLPFLDNILAHDRLRWVGNTNELNAGYCADAYARVRGFAAMVTTFGVGELSAINAVAGAYAEYAPVLHIVGAPARATQASGRKVHHTLGDGKFNHFYDMAAEVTCAQAWLTPANAAGEIDRVIRTMLSERRPGYLVLSPDVARAPIYRPDDEVTAKRPAVSSRAAVEAFKDAARTFLAGKKTTILADLLVHRLGGWENFNQLIERTDLPYATLAWGKTLVDERSPRFAGVYSGAASKPAAKDAVENAERLITLGVEFTDNTTAGFSTNLDAERIIEVEAQQASVAGRAFAPIHIVDAMDALTEVLTEEGSATAYPLGEFSAPEKQRAADDAPLEQNDLWTIVSEWLPKDSIVVADQGTSFFGMADRHMPAGSMFIGQPLWGSIGYSVPAALGAGLADRSRRPVLCVGDGSALLTIQEVATMVREDLNPIVLVINNSGYTVERAIHGADQYYNDIPTTRWELIPAAFGGDESSTQISRAATAGELKQALQAAEKASDKLALVEVMADRDDIPALLATTTEALAKNARS